MGNAEPTNGKKLRAPKASLAEAAPMPEPANSNMAGAMEATQYDKPREEKMTPEKTKEAPVITKFERINEKGEVEIWNERPVTRADGSKIYFLDDGQEKRYAILGEAERKAEKDMVEKGKKFKDEKVWQTFVSILNDAKESGKELPIQKYLIENRGRILEDAILTQEIDKFSPESALNMAVNRAANQAMNGPSNIGYKEVAKSIEYFANDYVLNNDAQGRTPAEQKAFIAEQKKAAERARLANLSNYAHGMGGLLKTGNIEGEKTESLALEDAYDNLKTRRELVRDFYGDEKTRSMVRGEVKKVDFHAPSVAYAEKELAKKRREAVAVLQEGKAGDRRAPALASQLLHEMNELRATVGREAVRDPEDMPQEWRYLWKLAQDVNAGVNREPEAEAPKAEPVKLKTFAVPEMAMPPATDMLEARAKKIRARRAEAEKVFVEGQMSPARRADLAPANLPVEDEVMKEMQQNVERVVAPVREKAPVKKVAMRKYTPPLEATPAAVAAMEPVAAVEPAAAPEAEFELMSKKEVETEKAKEAEKPKRAPRPRAPRTIKEQVASMNAAEINPSSFGQTAPNSEAMDVAPEIRAINIAENAPTEVKTEIVAETPEAAPAQDKKKRPQQQSKSEYTPSSSSGGDSNYTVPDTQQKQPPKRNVFQRIWDFLGEQAQKAGL